ncbi:MAG: GNAT family N-acetyltransferase [Phycisphaeraceae bacterium]|nr:GNAT family N-acetyltransferase [Phycisphaeraceae bacterium]
MTQTSSLTIEPANLSNPRHQRAVVDLLDHYARDPMGGGGPLAQDVRDRLIPGLRSHPTAVVLLAWQNDVPAGIALCFEGFSTFNAKRLINIHDLAVHADFRGRSIGRALLRAVEAVARHRGFCKITLEVRHDNAIAQALYRAEGYAEPSGDKHHFWAKKL